MMKGNLNISGEKYVPIIIVCDILSQTSADSINVYYVITIALSKLNLSPETGFL